MTKSRTILAFTTALAALLFLLPSASAAPAGSVAIRVLSNRADLLSGGDALVEVVLGQGTSANGLRADVDGKDVSSAFALRESGRIIGLLEGLKLGDNRLTVRVASGAGARLTLRNHPIGGPVFSGPQVQPWTCTTADNGLGEPLDAQCNAAAIYQFRYRTLDGAVEDYDPENPPAAAEIATTKTDQGVEVPYIVRIEKGALNRGLYQIAVLFDPTKPWKPWAPQKGWNGKLFYPFGASCNTNYSQGAFGDSVEVDQALRNGFAVATSGLNTLGQNCNTVTSAETVMMIKERIVEQYGEIRFTFGRGGSGGSIGQFVVGNAYPGLLQGLLPSATYPDSLTTGTEVFDCHLLLRYFSATSPHLWTSEADQTAVNGHMGVTSCAAWEALFSRIGDPTHGCGLVATSPVPTAGVVTPQDYHPVLNRSGCRATVQDMMTGVFGRREQDGFGKNLFDNIGVQYGLKALQDGTISVAQFLDINEKIGGLDIDLNFVPSRSVADPGVPRIMHETGLINDMRNLEGVAIIDTPATANIEIHTPYHAYEIDARMVKAYGHHENHVTWMGGPAEQAFDTMNAWLTAVSNDTSSAPLPEKILRHKPSTAVDSCFIDGEQVLDAERCGTQYPYFGDARMAAGSPIDRLAQKCTLKPLRRSDYSVQFTDVEWARLQRAFPAGVCDWTQPGIGRTPSQPWMSFADGIGGRPLGDAPASTPLTAPSSRGLRRGPFSGRG